MRFERAILTSPCAALILIAASAHAVRAQATEMAPCDLAAWVGKEAPADLAVRAGPGPDYPAIATVPAPYSDGEETYFPEARITGSSEGWFRIAEIVTDLYGGLATDPIIRFSGEGWLPGDALRLWVEAPHLRSAPSPDAPIAVAFDGAGGDSDGFRVDGLHACDGFWVEVDGTYSGKRVRGWTNDICASQVTTCP